MEELNNLFEEVYITYESMESEAALNFEVSFFVDNLLLMKCNKGLLCRNYKNLWKNFLKNQ